MIIGITGRARSGKDTAGDFIQSRYGIPKLAFADPLKEAAVYMFGITQEMAYGVDYDREQLVEPWGISVREMLQKLGTECARHVFRDDFWMVRADIALSEEPEYYSNGFVMTDIRFDNEAAWVRSKGGLVIKMHRTQGNIQQAHSSEKGVNVSLIDHFIPNEGTIEDLQILIKGVLDERHNKI